jgi:hypothetical protein
MILLSMTIELLPEAMGLGHGRDAKYSPDKPMSGTGSQQMNTSVELAAQSSRRESETSQTNYWSSDIANGWMAERRQRRAR